MALKDIWVDLENAIEGLPDSGNNVDATPINDIAHAVIDIENKDYDSQIEEKADKTETYKKSEDDTSITGQAGYYIHSINTAERWIILSTSETKPETVAMGSSVEDDSDPTENIGYAVDDVFSIINGAHYDFCGKITAVTGNKISYKSALPFNSIDTSATGTADHCLFVPRKPEVGKIIIVTVAFAAGLNAIGSGKAALVAGRDTVGGDYSAIFGRSNFGAYCSLVWGLNCSAPGRYTISGGSYSQAGGEYSGSIGCVAKSPGEASFSINNNTIAQGRYSFSHGLGTRANTDSMESGGMYNATQENMLVVYGNGTSDSNRRDAYTLDLNGNGTYDGRVKAESFKAERVVNTEFLKQDYFSNGKQPYTVYNYTGFDDLVNPGFYQVMWYNTEVQQGGVLRKDWTPWMVMVSVRKYDDFTTDIWQVREAYGPASGKRYWKDIRHGTTSGGVFTWGEWQEI